MTNRSYQDTHLPIQTSSLRVIDPMHRLVFLKSNPEPVTTISLYSSSASTQLLLNIL